MSIKDKLATSLGRKYDVPNQELAKEIAKANDRSAVAELIEILKTTTNKKIKSDCIKTLYEIGYIKPELIADYYQYFLELLKNKNNRLVWGAMIALKIISNIRPKEIYENLSEILEATEKGSVITNDNGISILINLSKKKEYLSNTFPLLMEQLKKCEPKQLPMYAERTLPIINAKNKNEFVNLLKEIFIELNKESQKKRNKIPVAGTYQNTENYSYWNYYEPNPIPSGIKDENIISKKIKLIPTTEWIQLRNEIKKFTEIPKEGYYQNNVENSNWKNKNLDEIEWMQFGEEK